MLHRNRICFAPEGGEGSDPPASGTTAPEGEKAPAWAEGLGGTMTTLNQSITQLVALANASRPTGTQPVTEEEVEEQVDEAELEGMSRAQFANYMADLVLKAVNKQVVGPLTQQIQSIKSSTSMDRLQGAVAELKAKNPDFMEWKDEMIALAKEHPGLPPDKLYKLARAEDPEKVGKLEAKYKPKGEAKGPIKFKGFGGLTPSQSGTGSRGSKMNGAEAATAAWAETVAALGGEPMFEE